MDESGDGPEFVNDVVAAHSSGGGGDIVFGVLSTVPQAMEHEDSEFWKAAIPNEITIASHEEIFQVFGPSIPRQEHMKVMPTQFLFSQKLVSLKERKQDLQSRA